MDGIIIINKPKGYTSHDIVHKVKKITKEKVGHTGTLDPNATGVLPLLIGKGTLASKYLINHDKIYEVTLKLGRKTDTADIEGTVIEEKEVKQELLAKQYIEETLKSFMGKQKQIPPIYSAIKVNGKKLYEYARKGQDIKIEPREIEIYNIESTNIDKQKEEIQYIVKCSKGTYIRSLCEDIATKLETVGYMKELNRIEVGDFNIKDSVTIEELEKNIDKYLISLEKLFENSQEIKLNNRKLQLFLNGVKITQNKKDGIYRIYNQENKFIGIGIVEKELLKRDIILDT